MEAVSKGAEAAKNRENAPGTMDQKKKRREKGKLWEREWKKKKDGWKDPMVSMNEGPWPCTNKLRRRDVMPPWWSTFGLIAEVCNASLPIAVLFTKREIAIH